MKKDNVEQRAVKIAAKVMVDAGLCRYDTVYKCGRAYVTEATCNACVRAWLLSKARKELRSEQQ